MRSRPRHATPPTTQYPALLPRPVSAAHLAHRPTDDAHAPASLPAGWFSWRALLAFAGPGALAATAFLDPGNLESLLQAGARTGYALLWLLAASTGLGWAMQALAIRLGVATGRDLATAAAAYYPPPARFLLWLAVEAAIVGADVQEVVGSALALAGLASCPLWVGVAVGAAVSFALLCVGDAGSRRLEALFVAAIATMSFTFGYMAADSGAAAGEIAAGLITPRVPRGAAATALAIVGAAVMPHNLFLHSWLVLPTHGGSGTDSDATTTTNVRSSAPRSVAIALFSLEAAAALATAFVINVFVVTVFASGRDAPPPAPVLPASAGLADAADYLGARFGPLLRSVWCVSLLASGQSATMAGALAGQVLVLGLFRVKTPTWARIAGTRALAVGPALALALSPAAGGAARLDDLAQGLNVLQAAVLPLAVAPLIRLTSSRAVMGDFATSPWTTAAAAVAAAALMACNAGTAVAAVHAVSAAPWWARAAAVTGAALYVATVAYLAFGPALAEGAVAVDEVEGEVERLVEAET